MVANYCCVVTDDHPIVRKGVRDLLIEESVCSTIVEADSAAATLTLIRQRVWDLLILDISLPDKHGLEVLKEVKLLRPKLPVLMLSLYPEREFALRALKAGASGYLTKEQAPAELLIAVKAILAGQRYVTASLADQMLVQLNKGDTENLHDGLSNREMEVLRLLGRGMSVSKIATDMGLSVKTISTYRTRLLNKLKLQSTTDLIRYAIGHQLVS